MLRVNLPLATAALALFGPMGSMGQTQPGDVDDASTSNSLDSFLTSLVINGAIAIIVVIAVLILRPKYPKTYYPRDERSQYMERKGIKAPEGKNLLEWIKLVCLTDDDTLFKNYGMDITMMSRFLKLCLRLAVAWFVVDFIILIPINVTGDNDVGDFDRLSMANVASGDPSLWAHFIVTYYNLIVFIVLCSNEWRWYLSYKQQDSLRPRPHSTSILLTDIPADRVGDKEWLTRRMDAVFPGEVEAVYMVRDLRQFFDLMERRDKAGLKRVEAEAQMDREGTRMRHKLGFLGLCGEQVDTLEWCEKEDEMVAELLKEDRTAAEKGELAVPAAFITFKSYVAAACAGQAVMEDTAFNYFASPAPEVRDVNWKNLQINLKSRQIRKCVVGTVVAAIVLFYTIPITFVSSLTTLESLSERLPFLEDVANASPVVKGFLEGFLPSLALIIFFAFLPPMMKALTHQEGVFRNSDLDRGTVSKVYIFSVFNVFLITTLAGSVLSEINAIIDDPTSIVETLAESLPSQASTFINLTLLAALAKTPMELLRLGDLIIGNIKLKMAKTEFGRKAATEPGPIPYGTVLSDFLLYFIFFAVYAPIAPLMILISGLYFLINFFVWRNQAMFVNIPLYDAGGTLWPVMFDRMVAAMFIAELTMIGVLGIKEMPVAAPLLIPAPIFLLVWSSTTKKFYKKPTTWTSLYNSSRMDRGLAGLDPKHPREPSPRRSDLKFGGHDLNTPDNVSSGSLSPMRRQLQNVELSIKDIESGEKRSVYNPTLPVYRELFRPSVMSTYRSDYIVRYPKTHELPEFYTDMEGLESAHGTGAPTRISEEKKRGTTTTTTEDDLYAPNATTGSQSSN
eukprot:Clim_evm11s211 gene=Clim_evmTU11s211